MDKNKSCEAKGLLRDLDDIIVRIEMGLSNLGYILEVAEYRNMETSLVEAFSCPLHYLRGICDEMSQKVKLLFAEFKEGNE